MRLWCLSFCDADRPKGAQWLGTCFVEAEALADAITLSHLHGCNPGGEVLAAGFPLDELPDEAKTTPRLTLFTTRESIPGGPASSEDMRAIYEWMSS